MSMSCALPHTRSALHIAPLEDDPETPTKLEGPDERQLGDLNHRYSLEDRTEKLTELQAMMANLVLFRRHEATLPHGVKVGSEVLWKQALCEVVKIDCTTTMHTYINIVRVVSKRTRMHGAEHSRS